MTAHSPKPHVLLSIPVYREVDPLTTRTLFDIASKVPGRLGIDVSLNMSIGCSLLDTVRGELATTFLATVSATHLLFVDSDVSFADSVIDDLLAVDQDIVVAPCPIRLRPDLLVRGVGHAFNVPVAHSLRTVSGRRLMSCEQAGTGVMLIARRVLTTLCERHPELLVHCRGVPYYALFSRLVEQTGGGPRLHLGEDHSFCRRARAAGFEIACLVDAPITHGGSTGCLADALPPQALEAPPVKERPPPRYWLGSPLV